MRAVARALLETAAFLELSEDDVVDPDSAVKAMESIASALSKTTPEERSLFSVSVKRESRRGRSAFRAEK